MESNLRHPYQFQETDNNTFWFETDDGLKYQAYFIEFPTINYKLYSFSFDREDGLKHFDRRIKDTVICILREFCSADNQILAYTCDVSDGHELARKRLFNKWFNEENDGSFAKFDFQSENIYVSLIAKKDFPIVNQAITDVNQLFADVISNK